MLLLDYKKGGGKKKTYKTMVFATPFLREGKEEKKRERPEVKKNTTISTQKCLGALKTGRKLFHFFGPQNLNF